MQYVNDYDSPLGRLLLAADGQGLTGVWFNGQKYFARLLAKEHVREETPILCQAKAWLDVYFSGKEPQMTLPLHLTGTDFQMEVWEILRRIPYGQTTTYGGIAREIAAKRGIKSMSAQAVGSAVGHNEVSIIVPCHRVIGTDGSLTGYAGGLETKRKLLELEGILP